MSNLPVLIGVCGFARSGKSTLAEALAERHGYTVLSPSVLVRRSLAGANPLIGFDAGEPVRVADVLSDPYCEVAWKQALSSRWSGELRRLAQRLGDEGSRQVLGDQVWIGAVLAEAREVIAGGGRVVIPSVRFRFDADEVLGENGVLVRVRRPGVLAANGHVSEWDMNSYPAHFEVVNDGTVDELVDGLVEQIVSSPIGAALSLLGDAA